MSAFFKPHARSNRMNRNYCPKPVKPMDDNTPNFPALLPGLPFSRSDSYHLRGGSRHKTWLFPCQPDTQASDDDDVQHGIPPLADDL
jgi:hypothetical protein